MKSCPPDIDIFHFLGTYFLGLSGFLKSPLKYKRCGLKPLHNTRLGNPDIANKMKDVVP